MYIIGGYSFGWYATNLVYEIVKCSDQLCTAMHLARMILIRDLTLILYLGVLLPAY
jgi:hypothetical protein